MTDIQFEEKKIQVSIKAAAKRGDMGSAKVRMTFGVLLLVTFLCSHLILKCHLQHLAREVVQSRRAVSRLYTNKAQLMSVGTSLTEQLGEGVNR